MKTKRISKSLQDMQASWLRAWPAALADWSPFVQLHEPAWCYDVEDEKREKLAGSFAMIRLRDHSVIISLRQVQAFRLASFAPEILAHEIGHHVLCPGDMTDNARLIARIRRGLPSVESYANYIANLYADLLINDRLQRSCGRRMDQVYQTLKTEDPGGNLWMLYMRIYESLWNLEPLTLTSQTVTPRVNQDALLGARLVRAYAKDWLQGAGRFACLCFPYVLEEQEMKKVRKWIWCDTLQAGNGGIPTGLVEIFEDELDGTIHPVEDPELTGLDPIEIGEARGEGLGRNQGRDTGRKSIKSYRGPVEYAEILNASGVDLGEREIAIQYYRERAIPHLIPFPVRPSPLASDPIPEGLDLWEPGSEVDRIDWHSTLITSPVVIPGVTTRERISGTSPGQDPETTPFDLYLGVDCSGSMSDPAHSLSFPVLAGAIISLSALRAGASVKVVLSGEPGSSVSTDGFLRNQHEVLRTMVSYLGTGYAFGIHRLAETFHEHAQLPKPVHILLVSDYDMFTILEQEMDGQLGWDVAKDALRRCKGGGTYVLQLPGYQSATASGVGENLRRMEADGWNVFLVDSMEEMLEFARQFSRSQFHQRVHKERRP
ncbi:MAG: VWA domain-containing protein [Planctomycetota bacterium]|jgi:hypothetical protein